MTLSALLCPLLLASVSVFHMALGDCPSPPRLEHAELTKASLAVAAFSAGTTLSYQCRPGYIATAGKAISITCSATFAWSEIAEFCERRGCGYPGDPVDGHAILTDIPGTNVKDTKYGANATFACNEGFRLVGRNLNICTASGTWSIANPTCDAVLCASPPSIANGSHTESEKSEFKFNEAVKYSCSAATFTLLGNDLLSCINNGNWSGPPPTCTVISCSDVYVANAVKTTGFGSGPFKYSESITFACNEGFTMKGQARVKCSENSEWSPQLPECVADGTSDPNGGANTVQNVGSVMLIVTVFLMNWLNPHIS